MSQTPRTKPDYLREQTRRVDNVELGMFAGDLDRAACEIEDLLCERDAERARAETAEAGETYQVGKAVMEIVEAGGGLHIHNDEFRCYGHGVYRRNGSAVWQGGENRRMMPADFLAAARAVCGEEEPTPPIPDDTDAIQGCQEALREAEWQFESSQPGLRVWRGDLSNWFGNWGKPLTLTDWQAALAWAQGQQDVGKPAAPCNRRQGGAFPKRGDGQCA